MKLDNKFFPAFMIVVAVLTVVAIVYSSFQHRVAQKERFEEAVQGSDSLQTRPLLVVNTQDTVSLDQFKGEDVVLVFWASWSDKSDLLLQEIFALQDQTNSLTVVAALVLDATESIENAQFIDGFIHVDGASLYNELKVPGIPSYVLFDKEGTFKYAHVGYQEGAGFSVLSQQLER
jgi:thioredoxin-related protein